MIPKGKRNRKFVTVVKQGRKSRRGQTRMKRRGTNRHPV